MRVSCCCLMPQIWRQIFLSLFFSFFLSSLFSFPSHSAQLPLLTASVHYPLFPFPVLSLTLRLSRLSSPSPSLSMSFSGILDRRALRTFHRSLHCLLRIGAELTLECKRDQLLLRTLAASHAAYVLLTIKNTFFMVSTTAAHTTTQQQNRERERGMRGRREGE